MTMTDERSSRREMTLPNRLLSPVVDSPARRISVIHRVAVFLHRPRFPGRSIRSTSERWHEWWTAQRLNVREWTTPGSRLLSAWIGADVLFGAFSVAVYIHFSPCNRVSEMVLQQLKEYRSHGFVIIFVSMCRSLNMLDLRQLYHVTGLIILRRNFARDFGAWHDVVPLLSSLTPNLKELLLVNDSVCGPLNSMSGLFESFRANRDGLFGLTESLAPRAHLQSYFLLARGTAAIADLIHFLRKMRLSSYKQAIIRRGEVRLSRWMSRRGHLVASLNGYKTVESLALRRLQAVRRLDMILPKTGTIASHGDWLQRLRRFPLNPTHAFWYELVECCGFPFLKTELLMRNPMEISDVNEWRRLVLSCRGEFQRLIEDHLCCMTASCSRTRLEAEGLESPVLQVRVGHRDQINSASVRRCGSGRKALLLLGMHRSGTSLLAHLLHRVGAALPPDIIGPGRGNPFGHWEPKNLVKINDHVFDVLKRRWDDVRAIDGSWFHSECAADLSELIRGQILHDYGQAQLLLIKDPRICRLLPLYLSALQNLDLEPLVILQLRPAQQVIQSLARRDGLAPELTALLWARSILEAERWSRDCSRVWVTLDNILTAPGAALDRIAEQLGISWPIKPSTLEFNQITGTTGDSAVDVAHWLVPRVWKAAEFAISGNEREARDHFDALWLALEDLDHMYTACFTRLYSESEARLDAVLHSTSWRVTMPLRAIKRFGRSSLKVKEAISAGPSEASDFELAQTGQAPNLVAIQRALENQAVYAHLVSPRVVASRPEKMN